MFRAVFITFLLVSTALFSLGAPRITELPFCDTTLVGRPFSEAEVAGPHPVNRQGELTVIVESQQKYDGIHQFVLKRKGQEWATSFAPEDIPTAPVGSPYNFPIMMGSPLAHFFGYSIVDDKHILVPGIETLNGKIDELSRRLVALGEKPIPARFYFTAGLEDGDRYNQEFAARGAFPISEDPVLFLHDLSFHLGSIALPSELVTAAQKVTAAVNLFADELKLFRPKATKSENIVYEFTQAQLVKNESQLIDFLFGNIVGIYTQSKIKKLDLYDESNSASVVQGQIWKFFTEQRILNLRVILQERFRDMLREMTYDDPSNPLSDKEILAILDARLEALIEKTPHVDWQSQIPHFDALYVFLKMDKNIAAMKAAIETP